jgi:hypothetical protein
MGDSFQVVDGGPRRAPSYATASRSDKVAPEG